MKVKCPPKQHALVYKLCDFLPTNNPHMCAEQSFVDKQHIWGSIGQLLSRYRVCCSVYYMCIRRAIPTCRSPTISNLINPSPDFQLAWKNSIGYHIFNWAIKPLTLFHTHIPICKKNQPCFFFPYILYLQKYLHLIIV